MADILRRLVHKARSLAGVGLSAATEMPVQPPPRVKGGQRTLPSYMTTARPNTSSALTKTDRRLANTDITKLRNGASTSQVIRDFVRSSPDLSGAVTAYVRTGVTSGYTAIAYNADGTVNPEGTALVSQIITRLNIINDYAIGFDDAPSVRSLSETWALEILKDGAMCGELVLDKTLLPYKLQAISAASIQMFPSKDGKRRVPKQKVGSEEIELDVPTFFMVTLDEDTTNPYPVSPIEPAIQAVIFSAEFMNDIRRIVRRAIHPRVVVTINEEKFKKSMPMEVQNDQEAAVAYTEEVVAELESTINGLEPEEALVIFDSIGIEIKDHGNTNLSNEYKVLQEIIDSKMSSGTKALPTVLGHANSTANAASAETLLFMKYVEGTIWGKLNEMFSKMLTLAVRLFGLDVHVIFQYNPIDLRPENELEAFRVMKQSRVLELLSLGLMSDDEAAILLTGHLPPKGYTPKSGTGFRANTSVQPAGDGYNGASNDGSALNKNLKPDTPTNAKSKNGGKEGN